MRRRREMSKWEVDEHEQWSEKMRSQRFRSPLLDKNRNYDISMNSGRIWPWSGEKPTFEVINFLSTNLTRFSYTKDFCSLHIRGLYLSNTQGFIANKNLWRIKKTDSNFY